MENMTASKLLVSRRCCHLLAAYDAYVVAALKVLHSCVREPLIHICCDASTHNISVNIQSVEAITKWTDGAQCCRRCNYRAVMQAASEKLPLTHLYLRKSATLFLKLRNVQYRSLTCSEHLNAFRCHQLAPGHGGPKSTSKDMWKVLAHRTTARLACEITKARASRTYQV